jgi:tetratricopeptide (TPR) repeat protein
MKCMDCVSVCPKDALHFGFARPSIVAGVRSALADGGTVTTTSRKTPYDFSFREEVAMAAVGLLALLCFRGLYGHIPLLLAMGMGGISAYIFGKVLRLVRSARFANVRFQNLQLKRGGRITRAGRGFTLGAAALGAFTFHSGLVQYHAWRGELLTRSLNIDDSVWTAGNAWWAQASSEQRTRMVDATTHLERVNQWGLMSTPATWADLTWLYLAQNRDGEAETALRRMVASTPDQAEPYRGLAGVLKKTGRMAEAQAFYETTLSIDPAHDAARADLADIHYDRGMAQLGRRNINAAIKSFQRAVGLRPAVAIYQYNLGVATFMAGRPKDALPHIRKAIRLAPKDLDAQGFEQVILQELDRK